MYGVYKELKEFEYYLSDHNEAVGAKVIQHSEPIYPPLARQTRIQGDVRVKFTTDGESVLAAEAEALRMMTASAVTDSTLLKIAKSR